MPNLAQIVAINMNLQSHGMNWVLFMKLRATLFAVLMREMLLFPNLSCFTLVSLAAVFWMSRNAPLFRGSVA